MSWYDTPCEDSDGTRTTLGRAWGIPGWYKWMLDNPDEISFADMNKAEEHLDAIPVDVPEGAGNWEMDVGKDFFGAIQKGFMPENELRGTLGMPLLEEKVEEPAVDEGPVLEFDEWVEETYLGRRRLFLTRHENTWVFLNYTGTNTEFWEICVNGEVDFYYRGSLKKAQQDVYLKLGHKVYG